MIFADNIYNFNVDTILERLYNQFKKAKEEYLEGVAKYPLLPHDPSIWLPLKRSNAKDYIQPWRIGAYYTDDCLRHQEKYVRRHCANYMNIRDLEEKFRRKIFWLHLISVLQKMFYKDGLNYEQINSTFIMENFGAMNNFLTLKLFLEDVLTPEELNVVDNMSGCVIYNRFIQNFLGNIIEFDESVVYYLHKYTELIFGDIH
jgi:hypothetical protein